jgi:hypothetical protein
MKITEPGIYRGISEADYRADPCPVPSFTQSLCKVIIERSPKHAWIASPRLNPQFEYDDDTKFDIGNVAHRLILGRGKEIEVLDFADWRTKAAQQAREEAADAGRIGVLRHQFDQAFEMVEAARKQLARHEDRDAFTDGAGEVMIVWQEDGIWFRSLIDWLHDDLRTVDDFKTSGMSMAPHVIGMRAEAAGWHIQAAFIERGLDLLDPAGAGRRRFRFIAQETDKPHALTSMHMNEYWMSMGRKKVDAAVALWRPALANNYWRGYGTAAVIPEYPGFKEKAWLERELAGDFEPMNETKMIMAG